MHARYTIGIDYGTESGRVLLVDIGNGNEIATHVTPYRHGVMDDMLPNGRKLETDWALQHPGDYLDVLYTSVPEVIRLSGVDPKDVIGIGIDFTSCTILPIDQKGEPLCFDEKWKNDPHSWVKLWKHHAAQKEADDITNTARARKEPLLKRYGGKISSEWMFPKILQVLREAPDIYEETDLFIEAGDWITYCLTNELVRSSNMSGYKAFWDKKDGYPDPSFLSAIDERLFDVLDTKMRGEVKPIAGRAGGLTKEMAKKMGLKPDTVVAVSIIDAHAGVPAIGAVHPGQFVMTMGTSTCHMLISEKKQTVEGICGVVEDGIIPGTVSYETGQVAVGDSFAWYIEQAVPEYIKKEAEQAGVNLHHLLERRASALMPGQSGLVALDWWNGNRTVLVDANLSGVIAGMTLSTKPEEIYRALLESTAFGTRKIIETFENDGIVINDLFACGGLPQKNKLLMQLYADILNREIKIADAEQVVALGAAIYAATAAGRENGGYDSIEEAASKMAKTKEETFIPVKEHVGIYEQLYAYYLELHDFFGRDHIAMMHGLKKLRRVD
jgi:L-ribulokinase